MMGRKKVGTKKTATVGVNLEASEIKAIDQVRGPATRSAWIRMAVQDKLANMPAPGEQLA